VSHHKNGYKKALLFDACALANNDIDIDIKQCLSSAAGELLAQECGT
jgi:hypothetical protein